MDICIYILVGCVVLKFGYLINLNLEEYMYCNIILKNNNNILINKAFIDDEQKNDYKKFINEKKIKSIINIITDLIFCTNICVVLLVMWFTLKRYI